MSESVLTPTRIARRSVQFHWRIALSIAAGVAVATAVITGALLVGDSMRGSLRALSQQRLGKIDYAVFPGGFFDPQHLFAATDSAPHDEQEKAAEQPQARGGASGVGEPIVYFSRGVLETTVTLPAAAALLEESARDPGAAAAANDGEETERQVVRRAGSVQILATDPSFWQLDTSGVRPAVMPGPDSVVLNAAAAAELGVEVGDTVTVRLPKSQAVPADSPLGRNEAESEGLPRMEVVDVIPTRGLGRFALSPSQVEPLNVYLSRELVTDILTRPGQANVLLIAESDKARSLDKTRSLEAARRRAEQLERRMRPSLADYGLQLNRIQQTFEGQDIIDYYSLSSDRLLIPDRVVTALREELGDESVHPVMTYLANKIQRLDARGQPTGLVVPYSTLAAVDSLPDLPLDYGLMDHGPLDYGRGEEESAKAEPGAEPAPQGAAPRDAAAEPIPLVLNSWAAERLSVEPEDRVQVTYFEPETRDGQEVPRRFVARVTDIVPITQPSRPYRRSRPAVFDAAPTVYNDPDLTPRVPGVTDQESIRSWNLPFQLEDGLVQGPDDDYWNDHRLTPKAFIPLAAGRELFGSRFGDTTSLRLDADLAADTAELAARIERALKPYRGELGFTVQPIAAQQLAASAGTTPFDVLFLLLSTFVIAAALMLIALLVRLGLVARATEYGTLLATGWSPAAAAALATREGLWAAVPGAAAGVALGMGYAYLVLWALRTWWVGAVTVPFLQFHASWWSMPAGLVIGIAMAWATIRFTTRQLRKTSPRSLLAGQFGEATSEHRIGPAPRRWLKPIAAVLVGVSLILGIVATQLGGQGQAGAFVGGGMLLLVATLLWMYARLRQTVRSRPASSALSAANTTDSLWSLAVGNARRNPLRSTLTIGLMASACFLILSMSAFQMSPTDAGVGGFDLIGQTAQPYFRPLADPLVQEEVFGDQADQLSGTTTVGLRVNLGQDASCNNLYKAMQPTVLGVPERLATLYESDRLTPFTWAATGDVPAEQSPWRALERPARGTADDPLPMVLDQATAMWALQIYGGVGARQAFEFDDGTTRHFEVVGLLSNSVLQGMVMIGEQNFKHAFPEISGTQYFLISTPPERAEAVAQLMEDRLGDVGMDITASRTVLARLLAVQNTYLRTFQSLGALGLLLGTIGLAVAQLRSVLERRGELAVMRAIGFTRFRLAQSVLMEHAALLLAGIGCGVFAALLAVIPYAYLGRAHVPLAEPLAWMAVVLVVGLLAGTVVLARVIRMPLIASLRSL